MDSIFSNIGIASIIMAPPVDKPGSKETGIVLDNVSLGGKISDNSGKQLLGSGYYKSVSILLPVSNTNLGLALLTAVTEHSGLHFISSVQIL
jgi:hypothetical protein